MRVGVGVSVGESDLGIARCDQVHPKDGLGIASTDLAVPNEFRSLDEHCIAIVTNCDAALVAPHTTLISSTSDSVGPWIAPEATCMNCRMQATRCARCA
jgi:hypothetical protein